MARLKPKYIALDKERLCKGDIGTGEGSKVIQKENVKLKIRMKQLERELHRLNETSGVLLDIKLIKR